MTESDKPAFLAVLTGLAAIKPGKPLTLEGLELYWMALCDWPLDEFRAAASHLARSVEFMPNPYHFTQVRKSGGQTVGEAWLEVRAAIRKSAYDNPPSLGPRIDKILAAMGGYKTLALTDHDHMPFRERRFAELWEEFGEAEESRQALPHLAEQAIRQAEDAARTRSVGNVSQLVKRVG